MKKVVLIGASGFVGSAILNELLDREYWVKAVVRHPEKITINNPNLEIVQADVSSLDTVAEICKGYDSVISAYNPGWKNPNIYSETLTVYPKILEGVKKAGVKRFLCVGGAGTLFVAPGVRVVDSGSVPGVLLPGVKGLGEFFLTILRNEEQIDWVFLSPAGNLEPGKRTGKFRVGKDDLIVDERGRSRISVEDYAVAMVNELEHPDHHKERFTVGY